jgi:hypothetical protein
VDSPSPDEVIAHFKELRSKLWQRTRAASALTYNDAQSQK